MTLDDERMKIAFAILITIAVFVNLSYGAEYKYEIPGIFSVTLHGKLYATISDEWNVIATETDLFPGSYIEITNSTGARVDIFPLDPLFRSHMEATHIYLRGDSITDNSIRGPHGEGNYFFIHSSNGPHVYGHLELGNLLLGYQGLLVTTSDWPGVQVFLESFRFIEDKSVQQGGAGYPPQGVGSPDP